MKHFSKKRDARPKIVKKPKTKPNKVKATKEMSKKKDKLVESLEVASAGGSSDSDVEFSDDNGPELEFENSDGESDDDDALPMECDMSDSEDEGDEDELHVPPDSLEVASDDSDFEEESQSNTVGKVTSQMVNEWEKELNTNKRSMKPVSLVVQAFHGCLIRVSGDTDSDSGQLQVDGSSVFNAVIRLCVTSIYPYLKKVLNLPASSVTKAHVENSKRWATAKNVVRSYIVDLIKLIGNVSSEDILRVLLKHLHQMIPFVACLPTISKPFLKRIISLWSTSEDDTVRVIAFLCILCYAASDLSANLHTVLKKMYFSYVVNCKFVSHNSVPAVNFMRKSLTEMFGLNETITYNHAFMYIRQLAIHLKSAVTLKKKDSILAVYNWQFISSLRLWVDVLCNMQSKAQLNSLIYPVIQVIIGCIKLIPTAQYLPLRFHCIQMLIKISKETGTFIPVLPFLIEEHARAFLERAFAHVITGTYIKHPSNTNFEFYNSVSQALAILKSNTQHKTTSMKPLDFTYVLRLSKAQLQDQMFKDAVVENVYDCLLQYTAHESYRMSFPDTVVVLQMNLKQFIKECKNANYVRKFKPLLEKIDETSKLISNERHGVSLADAKGIAAWESNMKLKSNALLKFYDSWVKIHEQKLARKEVEKIGNFEHELPELKKLTKKVEKSKKGDKTVLFDTDSEDGEDDVIEKLNEKCDEPGDSKKTHTKKAPKKKPSQLKRKSKDAVSERPKKSRKSFPQASSSVDDGNNEADQIEDLDLRTF